ncbi:hypothetical protein ADEAN_000709900 [Angomonas deanei]|uniref:C3H1-type domain-containing protein n=1 Tax=Angomonas deanei TaxID=59799 RepID=A0A7G2CIA7_9TRYP|nr:hypothetical protein ADEAN_000709900 [Angomonas deanei]
MSERLFLYIHEGRTLWVPGHTAQPHERDPVTLLTRVTPPELSKSFYLFEFPVQLVPFSGTPGQPITAKSPEDIQRAVNEFRMGCQRDQSLLLKRCYNPNLPPAAALPVPAAQPVAPAAPAPFAGGVNTYLRPPTVYTPTPNPAYVAPPVNNAASAPFFPNYAERPSGYPSYAPGVRSEPEPIDVDRNAIPKEVVDTYTNHRLPLVVATMPGPRMTAWLREFPVPQDRRDRQFVFCKGGIILMLKSRAEEVAFSKPVELLPKQICAHFLIHNYCSRPNCFHQHHTEDQVRLLIAARHVELKAMTKQERKDKVAEILVREKEGTAKAEEERQQRMAAREEARRVAHEPILSGGTQDGPTTGVSPQPVPKRDDMALPVVPEAPPPRRRVLPEEIGVTDSSTDGSDSSSSSSSSSRSSSSSSSAESSRPRVSRSESQRGNDDAPKEEDSARVEGVVELADAPSPAAVEEPTAVPPQEEPHCSRSRGRGTGKGGGRGGEVRAICRAVGGRSRRERGRGGGGRSGGGEETRKEAPREAIT